MTLHDEFLQWAQKRQGRISYAERDKITLDGGDEGTVTFELEGMAEVVIAQELEEMIGENEERREAFGRFLGWLAEDVLRPNMHNPNEVQQMVEIKNRISQVTEQLGYTPL